jgi:hypothetical protein
MSFSGAAFSARNLATRGRGGESADREIADLRLRGRPRVTASH